MRSTGRETAQDGSQGKDEADRYRYRNEGDCTASTCDEDSKREYVGNGRVFEIQDGPCFKTASMIWWTLRSMSDREMREPGTGKD